MSTLSPDLALSDVPLWAMRFRLTPQQAAFVDGYLEDFDAVRTFKETGYNGKDAKRQAFKLLCNRNVQSALTYRNEQFVDAPEQTASIL